jgi:hypothetical protein
MWLYSFSVTLPTPHPNRIFKVRISRIDILTLEIRILGVAIRFSSSMPSNVDLTLTYSDMEYVYLYQLFRAGCHYVIFF